MMKTWNQLWCTAIIYLVVIKVLFTLLLLLLFTHMMMADTLQSFAWRKTNQLMMTNTQQVTLKWTPRRRPTSIVPTTNMYATQFIPRPTLSPRQKSFGNLSQPFPNVLRRGLQCSHKLSFPDAFLHCLHDLPICVKTSITIASFCLNYINAPPVVKLEKIPSWEA